jgi:hypothetical protein
VDHVASGVPHGTQAHFAQEIEVVLIEQDELGANGLQQALIFPDAVGQHRIEECNLVTGLPKKGDHL